MMLVALFAVACSSEDDPTPSQQVADTYNGYTWASFFNGQYTQLTEQEKVAVTDNGDGTVTVVFTSNTWGTTTVSGASVTAGVDGYALQGTGTAAMNNHQTGTTSNYDCTLSGSISLDKSTVALSFSYTELMGGLNVAFSLGEAPDYMKVSGRYNSYGIASFMNRTLVNNNETISINGDVSNQTATLSYDGTWGKGSTTALTLEKDGDGYKVQGSGTVEVTSHAGGANRYDFTVEGTLNADKSDVSFTFVFELGNMGNVTVTTGLGYAPAKDFLPGNYSGYTSMSSPLFGGQEYVMVANETLSITANEDGTVNVTLSNGTISNATVTVENGVYTLAGRGTLSLSMSGPASPYSCEMTGTIDAAKENVEINFNFPDVMRGSDLIFRNGTAPSTEE